MGGWVGGGLGGPEAGGGWLSVCVCVCGGGVLKLVGAGWVCGCVWVCEGS